MIQNFLPQIEKEALQEAYHSKRMIVFSYMAFAGFVIAVVLLLLPFINANSKIGEINRREEQAVLVAGGQENIFSSPRLVNQKSATILALKNLPSVAERIVTLSDAKISGISIDSISYNDSRISISGTAKTRETLLSFQKSVQGVAFILKADVPVENFAKGNDLPFSMEISINTQE